MSRKQGPIHMTRPTATVNILGGARLIALRGKTIHHDFCRFALLSRRCYRIGAAEVMRQHTRIRNGDGGRTKICAICRPDQHATLVVDGT